ncbi:MAG: Protein PatA [Chroococcopsis gigantea SAG 12.99]|jgi:chemotaxis family two-component system response regulator PixG|nr:response regulator [Chlorogloea purpurea SAG 13.99]MDV2998621.1 Protein PatA [Chroococcopsis gigantea SAG 12.99]
MVDVVLNPNQKISTILTDPFNRSEVSELSSQVIDFNASKQASLFQKIKQREYSGKLILTDKKGIQSILYFYVGRIVYGNGGTHPLKRWQRHLAQHCPYLVGESDNFRNSSFVTNTPFPINWEYFLLTEWTKQQVLSLEQAVAIIRSVTTEILFDLTQAGQVSFYRQPERLDGFTPLTLVNNEQLIAEVWKQWQDWQNAKLADRSPNSSPIVKNLEELTNRTSPLTGQLLTQRLNGESTLRDLAVSLKQDVTVLTRSLMLYVQLGLIDLISVPDLESAQPKPLPAKSSKSPSLTIAYCDEQEQMCRKMAGIIEQTGHNCVVVQDGLQAISMFVEQRPHIIFLNTQLQHTDGYTICRALRQLAIFQNTPILMFAENVGLTDRIRAKMSGAWEIIDKSASKEIIHQIIAKYS